MTNIPELLAPAGQPDAAYAALHYGADAIYLGLSNFSARAEAQNFTPRELAVVTAHAHSLNPRRNVYLTLNTLIKAKELPAAVKTLAIAADCGVDAVIVQDLGIATLIRDHFPQLPIHASTQMAIHNLDGALAAKKLGCSRVTLARELTLKEVAEIARESGLEIETFIHGTLCYSYSGLCLFSSITTGRSGNRGRCVYSCREADVGHKTPAHSFSLKDMALGPKVLDLAKAGVASLKIEGRKKSPLYVAATVDYYRRILDGKLKAHETEKAVDRLKTIFARPWTSLFVDDPHNPDVADTDIVGHRGAPVGNIEKIVRTPQGPGIAFSPRLAVERHDGLQIDLPGSSRPFGFAVDNLYIDQGKGKPRSAFAAPADAGITVALPEDAPALTPGLPVYLSSSQEVKRSYPFPGPKNSGAGREIDFDATVDIEPNADGETCRVTARAVADSFFFREPGKITASVAMDLPHFPAREPDGPRRAAAAAFERTGGSRFRIRELAFANPGGCFVKPGDWNRLRRELVALLEKSHEASREAFVQDTVALLPSPAPASADRPVSWILCVDSIQDVHCFENEDFDLAEEIVITVDPLRNDTAEALEIVAKRVEREKIRLGVPLILRPPASKAIRDTVRELAAKGWKRWFLSNPGAFFLTEQAGELDLAADWPLYALNPLAAKRLLEAGCRSFTLSPEDDAENLRDMAAVYGNSARIVVYSELPLFISAACAHAALGLCAKNGSDGKCPHRGKILPATLEKSGGVKILPRQCGSVVTGERPFSLRERIDMLKAMGLNRLCVDLRWAAHPPDRLRTLWREAVEGRSGGGMEANFSRGIQ